MSRDPIFVLPVGHVDKPQNVLRASANDKHSRRRRPRQRCTPDRRPQPPAPSRRRREMAPGGRGTNLRHEGGDPRAPKARGGSAAVLRWLTSPLAFWPVLVSVPSCITEHNTRPTGPGESGCSLAGPPLACQARRDRARFAQRASFGECPILRHGASHASDRPRRTRPSSREAVAGASDPARRRAI